MERFLSFLFGLFFSCFGGDVCCGRGLHLSNRRLAHRNTCTAVCTCECLITRIPGPCDPPLGAARELARIYLFKLFRRPHLNGETQTLRNKKVCSALFQARNFETGRHTLFSNTIDLVLSEIPVIFIKSPRMTNNLAKEKVI